MTFLRDFVSTSYGFQYGLLSTSEPVVVKPVD